MMQPAESVMRQDATRGSGTTSTVRRSLSQSEMRAVAMVVADVFREQSLQMAFIERDDVVQQIAPAAFDPTLRHTILPGTFERGPHWAHLQRSNGYGNLEPVLRIPVEDQKPGGRFKRKRFPQLLDDPHARRMPGDVEMQDATTIVADDEEAVQRPESDRWNREEVHRGDSFPVVPQKRKPALGWLRVPRRSFHPTGDRSLGKIETEHEKLPMNAWCAPGRVLGHHTEHEIPYLFGNPPPAGHSPRPGDHTPIKRGDPDLCHRTTVSGPTRIRVCFHPRAKTQKNLSKAKSLGLGCLRFSAASCWRRTCPSSEAGWHGEKQGGEKGKHSFGSLHAAALQIQLFQRERTF